MPAFVDDDVEPPVALDGHGDETVRVVLVGDVGLDVQRARQLAGQPLALVD